MQSPNVKIRLPQLADESVSNEHQIFHYLRLVYRRRRIAFPVFLISFVVGAVNAVRQTPVYQAHGQILIESEMPAVASLDQMFKSGYGEDEPFRQTQYRLIQSRNVGRHAIDILHLWDAPLGNGPQSKGSISLTRPVWMLIGAVISLTKTADSAVSSAPPSVEANPAAARAASVDAPSARETSAQSSKIDQFLGGLSVIPVRNSRLVELRYTSTDPVFAAAAVNSVAKAYIQQNTEQQFSTTKEAADWLSDRLTEQRHAVESSEAALQAYKERHGTVPASDGASNIVVQRLTDLNAAVTKARMERINKESLYKQLKGVEAGGNLDTYPAAMSNEYVQKLKGDLADLQKQQALLAQRYGERHAEMIRIRRPIDTTTAKLKTEMAKMVESVQTEYQTAAGEEQGLQKALDDQKREALGVNRQGIELGVLQREAESNRQIYEGLMKRTKETGLSREIGATNVRIVDEAEVPRGPISPDVPRDLTYSFGASLLIAIALALGVEQIDSRIRTPQEVKSRLGVAFLGMIPSTRSKNAPLLVLNEGTPVNFIEAFKTVRTNVLFSSAADGMRSLVVTSAGPGEGKSVVAANLAIALAQTGLRVLLIDADLRRPRVHEIFDVPKEPGLSNVLTNHAKLERALIKTSVNGLSLLTAGRVPPNPAELLASEHYRNLIESLGQDFDWAIIDTPPVLAVADSMIASNGASGVLFVVRADKTARQAARTALEQLDSTGGHLIGAVLNGVHLTRHPYYYTGYYRKAYARYYTSSAT